MVRPFGSGLHLAQTTDVEQEQRRNEQRDHENRAHDREHDRLAPVHILPAFFAGVIILCHVHPLHVTGGSSIA